MPITIISDQETRRQERQAIADLIKDRTVNIVNFLYQLSEHHSGTLITADVADIIQLVGRMSGRVEDPTETKMFLLIHAAELAKATYAEGREHGELDGMYRACMWTQEEQQEYLNCK